MIEYRLLTELEINQLVDQGCGAENWTSIQVVDSSSVDYVKDCDFSGFVRLGRFNSVFEFEGGFSRHSGIRHAALHNVTVGNDCFIGDVSNYISNYIIGDSSYLCRIDTMQANMRSNCGNGLKIAVLNEMGGTPVKMYDSLSAQEAYLMAVNSGNKSLIKEWDCLIETYISGRKEEQGFVGRNVKIVNVGRIEDVHLGDYSELDGTARMTNCSLMSSEESPVSIGHNVICEDVIICGGSSVRENSILKECFIGQSCHIGSGYTASSSLIFCNSELENGEGCALFAGPFTVSHHKATLLIAGMFSFFNAGSCTNQSNHMYKLGPMHCGILQRGSKTASGSHILWPARVGAFTMVMGKLTAHMDTTDFPFSYLIGDGQNCYLLPGANLCTVGTYRDEHKWPNRDKREEDGRLDWISYSILNPFTIQQVLKGEAILKNMLEEDGLYAEKYNYQQAVIKSSNLNKGLYYYEMALDVFIGRVLMKHLGGTILDSMETLTSLLSPTVEAGDGEWDDVVGMLVPSIEIKSLLKDIETGKIVSVEDIKERLQSLYDTYDAYEWTALLYLLRNRFHFLQNNINIDCLVSFLKKYIKSQDAWMHWICKDARKEMDWGGISQGELMSFVGKVERELSLIKFDCDKIIQRLEQLKGEL